MTDPIEISARDFDKERNTITIDCPHDVYMANAKALNDTHRLLPFVDVISKRTGEVKRFINPGRSFNYLMYECDGITLRLKM